MKRSAPYLLLSIVVFVLTLQISALLSRPPRWILNGIDNTYADQCESGEFYGVRIGMTRRDVLKHAGMLAAGDRSDWYIIDAQLALPPHGLQAPVWPVGRLPDRLTAANEWTLLRAGYSSGFEMKVRFEQDRVECADVVYHVPMF